MLYSLTPRLLLICLFSVLAAIAAANEKVTEFQTSAQSLKLAETHAWKRMLHLNENGVSYVDDEKFFLSPEGREAPDKELLASIAQLIEKPQLQCKFPWRSRWLGQNIAGFSDFLVPQECPEYKLWRKRLNANSVTLVLASSYLNSPSSMYGHTFLRIDSEGANEQGKALTSYAVNFAAFVEGSAGFSYAYKGLFGGYPGYFSDGPYFKKVKEYSRLDNRDVWEYRLNLTPDETDIMLAHLWELNEIKFDYYFFDENCSFRLLELLEVARDGTTLTTDFDVYAIPLDTVRSAERAGLIEDVVYRPSNRRKLEFNLEQLTKDEQKLAWRLSQDKAVWESEAIQSLPDEKRYKVAEVSYQYLRYLNNRSARNQKIANHSLFLLRKMRDYAEYAKQELPAAPVRPEKGHDTRALTLTGGFEEGEFIDIAFRSAYHDFLDNIDGYPLSTELIMAGVKLRYKKDDHLQLQELQIIEISSLNPRTRFFKPISWRVRGGLERQWTNGEDELVGKFDGGAGWTLPIVGNLSGYLLGQGRIEYNGGFDQQLDMALGATAGFLLQHSVGSFMLEAQQYHFSDGVDRRQLEIGYQLPIAKNHGLRLQYKRILNDDDGVTEASMSYRFYY